MITAASAAVDCAIQGAALASALQTASLRLASQAACSAVEASCKGASRCLRSTLSLLAGEGNTCAGCDAGCSKHCAPGEHCTNSEPCTTEHCAGGHHVLGYASTAIAAIGNTVSTAFHEKSYWTAAALLDVAALWAVWRSHKHAHAEAAAAASLRRAAADPANPSTSSVQHPSAQDLALLQCAAVHAKAAYGGPAASGDVSSALGYLSLITVGQATRKAPRNIRPAEHLRAVQQLTGCSPGDVLAAQWVAHLHRPTYYVAIDRQRHMVVVSVRGTLQLGDYATVLDAVPQPVSLCGSAGHVHGGFMAAARNMLPAVTAALQAAAQSCPGWPVLVCGHSLGGGVAAVLTMLLVEQRQQEQEAGLERQQGQGCQLGQGGMWSQLGELRCVGVGAAAAFCRDLGGACRDSVTSVLYGADCLPMFSVLGARLLIEEVHARSRAAAAVGSILRRTRLGRWQRIATSGAGSSSTSAPGTGWSSEAASLARSASTASTATSMVSCEVLCSTVGCRGQCTSVAEHAAELAGAELLPAAAEPASPLGMGSSCLQRSQSAWSSSGSTASIAAFAAEAAAGMAGDRGAALVPMFPPGRILWLLPQEDKGKQQGSPGARAQQQAPQLVVTDQSAFERFLFTTETATAHLPDFYISAIDAVGAAAAAGTRA